MKIKEQLPPFYSRLLPAEILNLNLLETKATCENCAMAKGRHRGPIYYDEKLKCCTFYPYIPNYIVGAILDSNDESLEQAQQIFRQKISKRQYSLPIGMVAPVRYQVEFNNRRKNEFGNRADWLCPYYHHENQNCGIWRFRGSVCTSFYCKSSYGQKGLIFWKSLENYLSYLEMALMEEALAYLDFSPRQVSDLLGFLNREKGTRHELKTWVLPEKKAQLLWNGYYDEQEEFFKKCFRIINEFDKKSFHEALGQQGQQIYADLEHAMERLGK